MTCVVAVRSERGVVMGGDSIGGKVSQYQVLGRRDPKVFRCGEFLIGYTTSFRMAQLLRYGLHDALRIEDLKPPPDPAEGFEFMVREFVPRARYLFDRGGFMETYNGQESGGTFLVAWCDQLYGVGDDLQVMDFAEPFAAVGCGDEYALGSLFNTVGRAAPDRVRAALEAASRFSAYVGGPLTILETSHD